MDKKIIRCWNTDNQLHIKYHDEEWGVPLHDDQKLFEFLVLSGFQAGLSWWLILERRENFRMAFENFNPEKIALYTSSDVERLMATPKIIRNKKKIIAAINNARCFIKIKYEFGSFASYIWGFVGGKVIVNSFEKLSDLPTETEESKNISRALKNRGFQFVGPTICYAFIQAAGLVNDHLISCFRHKELLT